MHLGVICYLYLWPKCSPLPYTIRLANHCGLGEGSRAFRRLQEEIIRRSNDLTILAWDQQRLGESVIGVLASSPDQFAQRGNVTPFRDDYYETSITNKGLLISRDIPLRRIVLMDGRPSPNYCYAVHLGTELSGACCICLRKIGPRLFSRRGDMPVIDAARSMQIAITHIEEGYYIVTDPSDEIIASLAEVYRNKAVHTPRSSLLPRDLTLDLVSVAPEDFWDVTEHVFFRPRSYWSRMHTTILASRFISVTEFIDVTEFVELVVLCIYANLETPLAVPVLKLFDPVERPTLTHAIWTARTGELLDASQLLLRHPELRDLSDHVIHETADGRTLTRAYLEHENSEKVGPRDVPHDVYSIRFEHNIIATE